jgi:serralysin
MAIYYVATDGSNFGDGSTDSPWRTITYAMRSNLQPGDEVVVRSGTYHEAVVITKDGTADNYITVRADVPGEVKVRAPVEQTGITIAGDYVKLDGFDVAGSNKGGITGSGVHHVEVTNNIVHDNVNNGIFLGRADFFLVEGNIVYNNAAEGGASGIHLKAAYNITGNTTFDGFRIIVRDNIAFDNVWEFGPHTDANGIILDDFRNTQIASLPAYEFKTLVEDNLTYSNSGRGIQVAWSDYATLRGNIAWNNMTHQESEFWRGEFSNMGSNFNTWLNNIAVADSTIHPNNSAIINVSFQGDPTNQGVTWFDNITFNGIPGDPALFLNRGNSGPTAANGNQLGVDPGLDLDELEWDVPGEEPTVPGISVHGNADANILEGGAGNDSLYGYNGPDSLSGGDGDDQLLGGNGMDTMVGGDGEDVFVYRSRSQASAGETINDFADGDLIDVSDIDARARVDGEQSFTFIGANEFTWRPGDLRYADGVVSGDVNGDRKADITIRIANGYALDADDFILGPPPVPGISVHGDAGGNILTGTVGNDYLYGYNGADSLSGGDGDDQLLGGNGMDTLSGGNGDDVFMYRITSHGNLGEVITDFFDRDVIDLGDIDARSKIDGEQSFTFIGADPFTSRAGDLRYADGVVSGDVNGDRNADLIIRIANNHLLVAEDFIL